LQYLLGVLTLVYLVPVPLAAAHQALALAIVAVWIISVHHVGTVIFFGGQLPITGRSALHEEHEGTKTRRQKVVSLS
jgi:hypothetical protein